jgi:hypothetical protein
MGDLDTKAWIEVVRSYQHLRRRTVRYTLAYVGCFVGFVTVLFIASAKKLDALAGTLFLLFIPASCMLGLVVFLGWFDLKNFRCPRCGKRFIVAWWGSWPTDRCKHCGLDVEAAVRKAEKPLDGGDLWE